MLSTTYDAVRSILKTDPTVPAARRNEILAAMRESEGPKPQPMQDSGARLIRRGEAAARVGLTVQSFDRLCRQGAIEKIRLPGRTRAAGVRESDLAVLIAGKTNGT